MIRPNVVARLHAVDEGKRIFDRAEKIRAAPEEPHKGQDRQNSAVAMDGVDQPGDIGILVHRRRQYAAYLAGKSVRFVSGPRQLSEHHHYGEDERHK
jgi:hypothetical protein